MTDLSRLTRSNIIVGNANPKKKRKENPKTVNSQNEECFTQPHTTTSNRVLPIRVNQQLLFK